MGKVPRAMLSGRRLSTGYAFNERTRKSCKCCKAERLPDQEFSLQGFCTACSTARLLSSLTGGSACEHWAEESTGRKSDYHLALISPPH